MVTPTPQGLLCRSGGFYLDPASPVETAVLTHAHSDHARVGSGIYYCAGPSLELLRRRLGPDATLKPVPYGDTFSLGDVRVSFHPAGHILGSAQVRMEKDGEVWVLSGDYKRDPDPTCEPFEPIRCDVFITEATFALPLYRWEPMEQVVEEILAWWDANRARGRNCLLGAYALGKAQRILAELGKRTDRVVLTHGAVENLVEAYRKTGIDLPPTRRVPEEKEKYAGELVLAPPAALSSPWARRFGDAEIAFASGWMQLRGNRRRRGFDRGFVISDHADWPSLVRTVEETGARRVLVTHGSVEPLIQFLSERGIEAAPLATQFEGEGGAET